MTNVGAERQLFTKRVSKVIKQKINVKGQAHKTGVDELNKLMNTEVDSYLNEQIINY